MGLEKSTVYWYRGEHPHRDGSGRVCPGSHTIHLASDKPEPPVTATLPCHICCAPAVKMSRREGILVATGLDPDVVIGAVTDEL